MKKDKKTTEQEVDLKVQLEAQELKKDQQCLDKINAALKEYGRQLAASVTINSQGAPEWKFMIVRK